MATVGQAMHASISGGIVTLQDLKQLYSGKDISECFAMMQISFWKDRNAVKRKLQILESFVVCSNDILRDIHDRVKEKIIKEKMRECLKLEVWGRKCFYYNCFHLFGTSLSELEVGGSSNTYVCCRFLFLVLMGKRDRNLMFVLYYFGFIGWVLSELKVSGTLNT